MDFLRHAANKLHTQSIMDRGKLELCNFRFDLTDPYPYERRVIGKSGVRIDYRDFVATLALQGIL